MQIRMRRRFEIWACWLLAGSAACQANDASPPIQAPPSDEQVQVDPCAEAVVLGQRNRLAQQELRIPAAELRVTQAYLVPEDLVSVLVSLEAPGAIPMWDRLMIDGQMIARFSDLLSQKGLSRAMTVFPNVTSFLYPNNEATSTLGRCLQLKASVLGLAPETRLTFTTLRRDERALGDWIEIQFRVLDDALQAEELAAAAAGVDQVFAQACRTEICLRSDTSSDVLHLTSESGSGVIAVDPLMPMDGELAQLASIVDEDTPRALNVVFVKELTMADSDEDYTLLGVAGGIPSAPFDGTPASSLLVSVDGHRNRDGELLPELLSSTIAHEIGHMMGLFHTTEQNGRSFDPIKDTPTCTAKTYDVNLDGVVDVAECQGVGAANLMFWSADVGSPNRLTSVQTQVLRSHPLVYRYE